MTTERMIVPPTALQQALMYAHGVLRTHSTIPTRAIDAAMYRGLVGRTASNLQIEVMWLECQPYPRTFSQAPLQRGFGARRRSMGHHSVCAGVMLCFTVLGQSEPVRLPAGEPSFRQDEASIMFALHGEVLKAMQADGQ